MPLRPVTDLLGIPFVELQSVDSTNKYAMSRIREGSAQHGLAVLAHEQTTGKGQRGKNWSSGTGNLTISIVVNPYPLKPSDGFHLIACSAVSVYDLFYKHAGDETRIKWPNDLYWGDRKAGGILVENVIGSKESGVGSRESGAWKWSVIGIGININQTSFPDDLPNPVSLKQVTGKNYETVALAKELCGILSIYFDELKKGGFKNIYSRYQQVLYKKDQKVKLKKDNRIFETTIKGVSETGQLVTGNAIEEKFEFGEIEWL